jgi:hypothetical protein
VSLVPPVASGAAVPPATAEEAWKIELTLRPWRNMPLPMVNLANMLSSSALILLLAGAGLITAWRAGPTSHDRMMVCLSRRCRSSPSARRRPCGSFAASPPCIP